MNNDQSVAAIPTATGDEAGAVKVSATTTTATAPGTSTETTQTSVLVIPFWRGVFSDAAPPFVPSFSRVASGACFLACLGWDTFTVVHDKALPDWDALLAQAMFCATAYSINQAMNLFSAWKGGGK